MSQWDFTQECCDIATLPLPWEKLKGKRIFLTGATGFIVGYLAKALCWLNNELTLDLKLSLFHRDGTVPAFSASGVQWVGGEITGDFLPEDFCPDIIIHGASPANKRMIYADPVGVVNCNILAVRYLLECARRNGSTLVFFSSGEVYQRESKRITEKSTHDLAQSRSLSLYGNSKLAGELLCEKYEKYGVDYRILRPFSVFGPGESLMSGRCFTDFIRQALETHTIRIDDSSTQIRSYCYLSDFVSGLLYVLLCGECTAYNMGNEDNTSSILELAQKMAQICGKTEVIGPLSAGGQVDCFLPDTTKLRKLGWRPQVDLQDCIKRCLDSYR